MKVISFSENLNNLTAFIRGYIHPNTSIDAHKPYLFAQQQYARLEKAGILNPFFEAVSEAYPLLRELHAEEDGKGKPILIFNNIGGMGDNIVMWAFAKILHKRGYEIHILTVKGYEELWQNFPWVTTISSLPVPWHWVQTFHAHIFFEHLTNWYVHQDQGHPLDIMLAKVGIDPNSVPESEKYVRPEFTHLENQISNKLFSGKQIAFFQMSASQIARSPSPEQTRKLLSAVAQAFPELHWIGIYGPRVSPFYYEPPISEPNVECRSFERMRIFWALLRRAKVCISPDSMLVHAAGTLGIPCVGLWGIHEPNSRVKYYSKHFPIFLSHTCHRSPCYWSGKEMPNFCPDEIPDRTRCGVIQAITPEIVVEKVREALASSHTS